MDRGRWKIGDREGNYQSRYSDVVHGYRTHKHGSIISWQPGIRDQLLDRTGLGP